MLHILDCLHEETFVSYQRWGASWAGLEPPILRALDAAASRGQVEIVGIELRGPNPYGGRNLDHHRYADEDRRHPQSSIEQLARCLGVTLTKWQRQIAVNDREYIPGLLRDFPGMSAREIEDLRRRDRRAQGLTEEDEQRAREDLGKVLQRGRRYCLRTEHRPNAAHSDFLWTSGVVEDLLICSSEQWQYSGPRTRSLAEHAWVEGHWSSDAANAGYFCIEEPGLEAQSAMLELLGW